MNPAKSYYLGRNPIHDGPPPGTLQARDLDIRIRAFELWEAAGSRHGEDWAHWFHAVREFEDMVEGW